VANDEVDLKLVIFRAATTTFEDGGGIRRVINNLQGGREVGFFAVTDNITLNQNDYIKFQVANDTSTANITAELDSYFTIEAR
jgi:predicted HAD superfamily hydrolase